MWNLAAVHVGVQRRADGARLTVTIGWELLDQEYVAIAIQSAEGVEDAAMLDAHAHTLLGRFKTEAGAKEAGEDFARKWRTTGASPDGCDCGPIEVAP